MAHRDQLALDYHESTNRIVFGLPSTAVYVSASPYTEGIQTITTNCRRVYLALLTEYDPFVHQYPVWKNKIAWLAKLEDIVA